MITMLFKHVSLTLTPQQQFPWARIRPNLIQIKHFPALEKSDETQRDSDVLVH